MARRKGAATTTKGSSPTPRKQKRTTARMTITKPPPVKRETSSPQLQWPPAPTHPSLPHPPPVPMASPSPPRMTLRPWPRQHLGAMSMQARHRCLSEPPPDTTVQQNAPLMQVNLLVSPYGTLVGSDTWLLSQKRVWTHKQQWIQRHKKWRAQLMKQKYTLRFATHGTAIHHTITAREQHSSTRRTRPWTDRTEDGPPTEGDSVTIPHALSWLDSYCTSIFTRSRTFRALPLYPAPAHDPGR
jgi:hypothetical protein